MPRSIENPLATNEVNVNGFLNVLVAARDERVKRLVYASSSSVYGDHPGLPKVEEHVGRPLAPCAASKATNETYAHAFAVAYDTQLVGLRYFNVFGPRQDPSGPYVAVMPLWFASLLGWNEVAINGDGETSREFCYVANVVQANVPAAMANQPTALDQVYNIACGERTTLSALFSHILEQVAPHRAETAVVQPTCRPFGAGDVRHSHADIGKARRLLEYSPTHSVRDGLELVAEWYAQSGRS